MVWGRGGGNGNERRISSDEYSERERLNDRDGRSDSDYADSLAMEIDVARPSRGMEQLAIEGMETGNLGPFPKNVTEGLQRSIAFAPKYMADGSLTRH
jgi:hypothetical protein